MQVEDGSDDQDRTVLSPGFVGGNVRLQKSGIGENAVSRLSQGFPASLRLQPQLCPQLRSRWKANMSSRVQRSALPNPLPVEIFRRDRERSAAEPRC